MIDILKIKAELKKQGLPENLAELLNIESEDKLVATVTSIRALTPTNLDELSTKPGFDHLVGQINSMKQIQSDYDKKVADALKTFETNFRAKNTVTPIGEPIVPPVVNPAFAEYEKKLADANAKMDAFINGQNKARLTGLLHESLAKEKIPLTFASGIEVNNEEEIVAALAKVKVTYTEAKQAIINESFGGVIPKAPNGEVEDQTIADYAKHKNEGTVSGADGIVGKPL